MKPHARRQIASEKRRATTGSKRRASVRHHVYGDGTVTGRSPSATASPAADAALSAQAPRRYGTDVRGGRLNFATYLESARNLPYNRRLFDGSGGSHVDPDF